MTEGWDGPTIAEWAWLVLPSWKVLHHGTIDVWDERTDETSGDGVTACGRRGWLAVPGVITRMGAPRCKICCRRLGYPEGKGSPKDSDECAPLVEARLNATRDAASKPAMDGILG